MRPNSLRSPDSRCATRPPRRPRRSRFRTSGPEQKQTEHDKSEKFDWKKPAPLTPALKDQPNGGRITGFEFSRDPLGADKPFQTFDEVMKKESEAEAEGDGRAAEAARGPLRPHAEARPEREDGARQADLRRPDRPARRTGMTWEQARRACRPADIKKAGRVPVPVAAAPAARQRRAGVPADADQDVPAARTVRRGLRHPRGVPAGVPAGDLPPEPAGTGRRVARAGRPPRQLPRPVQGDHDAGAARRDADAADAAAAGGVQPDRRPQDAAPAAWASRASTAT